MPRTARLSLALLLLAAEARADSYDTVLVQGNKADALKAAGSSGTTITQQEIERAQPESSSEMLRRVPGLQIR